MNGAIGSVSLKDCCDKCADDEACKQDKNGCECWKPASVSNTQEMKNTKSISVRYPTFTDAMNGAIGSVSLKDCCDKCADDEACICLQYTRNEKHKVYICTIPNIYGCYERCYW